MDAAATVGHCLLCSALCSLPVLGGVQGLGLLGSVQSALYGGGFRVQAAVLLLVSAHGFPQFDLCLHSGVLHAERLGVIYGDFATRELASAELAKLAPTGAGSSPYIRTVSKLR